MCYACLTYRSTTANGALVSLGNAQFDSIDRLTDFRLFNIYSIVLYTAAAAAEWWAHLHDTPPATKQQPNKSSRVPDSDNDETKPHRRLKTRNVCGKGVVGGGCKCTRTHRFGYRSFISYIIIRSANGAMARATKHTAYTTTVHMFVNINIMLQHTTNTAARRNICTRQQQQHACTIMRIQIDRRPRSAIVIDRICMRCAAAARDNP